MPKYRIKPEDVEAEKFNGRNWHFIESWLGEYLTKSEKNSWDQEDVSHFVFDIAEKVWLFVVAGEYIVRDLNGAISVVTAREFESKWEVAPPLNYLTQPPFQYMPSVLTNPGISVTYRTDSGNS